MGIYSYLTRQSHFYKFKSGIVEEIGELDFYQRLRDMNWIPFRDRAY